MIARLAVFGIVVVALGAALLVLAEGEGGGEAPAAPEAPRARGGARPSDPVERALEVAFARLREGRFEDARATLAPLAEGETDDARPVALLARVLLDERRAAPYGSRPATEEDALVARALEHAARALALDPDEPLALQTLYTIHMRPALRAYDPERARGYAERLVALQPGNAAFVLDYANEMFGYARFPRPTDGRIAYQSDIGLEIAALQAQRLFDRSPVGSEARYDAAKVLARATMGMGDFDGGRRAWARVLEIEGGQGSGESRFEYGFACLRAGLVDEALAAFADVADCGGVNERWARWLIREATLAAGRPLDAIAPEHRFALAVPRVPAEIARRWRFTDVAPALGVDKVDGAGPSVFADVDGDRVTDVLAVGCDTFSKLYLGDGAGGFVERTAVAGLAELEAGFSSTAVDYDDDGDLDLYVARYGWCGPGPNTLLRNDGGRFVDATDAAGLRDPGSSFNCAWADFDGDLDLDLLVVNGVFGDGSTCRLYRNDLERGRPETATFVDVTLAAGLAERPGERTIGCAVGDYDKDGDVDVFLNAHGPTPNRLYRNRGDGSFDEVAQRAGLLHPTHSGYVAFFVDVDNDTWPDLITTHLADWHAVLAAYEGVYTPPDPAQVDLETVKLFVNQRDGTFRRVTRERDPFRPAGVMGATVGDFDNDGFVDLYLATGNPEIKRLEPNVMWRNDGDLGFTDVTFAAGVGHVGKGHGATVADYDADGDLDLYAPQGGFFHADLTPNALYRNELDARAASLRVRLRGTTSNRFAVGARLTLRTARGLQYREVCAARGFGSSGETVEHFGLGNELRPLSLHVRWPSGREDEFELAGLPLAPGEVLELLEGEASAHVVPR